MVLLTAACGESQPDNDRAPDFSLPDARGQEVVLADLVREHDAVVVIFYRGFF